MTLALTVITALLSVSCSVSRKAVSEHSELKIESSETVERVLARASEQVRADSVIVEQRDTLREVLGRAKRQSRATTITIDRNDKGDTLKVVQITDLTRARSRVGVVAQRVKTEVLVRDKRQSRARVDTVYVEKRDSVMVQNTGLTNPTDTTKGSGFRATLKWIFWILIGLIGLIVTVKVCSLRR